MFKKYFPHLLLAIYVVEFIIAGIHPFSRDVWYAENGPIFILVAFIVFLYFRNIRFSNTAYAFMLVLPFLHTIGGHYTFEKVPFDWFGNLFGFERNMFDRVAHFTVGFYALPIMEYFLNRNLVAKKWIASTYAIFTISFVAVLYEWIEWIYAEIWGGDAGAAFLGSQGDIWDAQKDMLMDVSGAVFVVILYFVLRKFKKGNNEF